MSPPSAPDQDLWSWACAAYARPDAKAACLELQDAHGLDVDVVLWIAWRCARAAPPDDAALDAARALSARSQSMFVKPLRALRRLAASKDAHALAGAERADALAARIVDAELEAERAELEALQAIEGARAPEGDAAAQTHAALEAYAKREGARAPALIARVVEALTPQS